MSSTCGVQRRSGPVVEGEHDRAGIGAGLGGHEDFARVGPTAADRRRTTRAARLPDRSRQRGARARWLDWSSWLDVILAVDDRMRSPVTERDRNRPSRQIRGRRHASASPCRRTHMSDLQRHAGARILARRRRRRVAARTINVTAATQRFAKAQQQDTTPRPSPDTLRDPAPHESSLPTWVSGAGGPSRCG